MKVIATALVMSELTRLSPACVSEGELQKRLQDAAARSEALLRRLGLPEPDRPGALVVPQLEPPCLVSVSLVRRLDHWEMMHVQAVEQTHFGQDPFWMMNTQQRKICLSRREEVLDQELAEFLASLPWPPMEPSEQPSEETEGPSGV
jgi:hypothetical protein